jgi:hypothetical protein
MSHQPPGDISMSRWIGNLGYISKRFIAFQDMYAIITQVPHLDVRQERLSVVLVSTHEEQNCLWRFAHFL